MNEAFLISVGLIAGFVFAISVFLYFDTFSRVKILRSLTKKNFGLIFIVGRGKQISTLVKNLDEDTIWIDNNVWVIDSNRIYRKDNKTNVNAIESKHINTISGIPVLFLSLESMKPLDFFSDENTVKPQEIGATLRAWLYNQYAKMLFFKKTIEIAAIVIIVLLLAITFFSYVSYNNSQEIAKITKETLEIVKNITITK